MSEYRPEEPDVADEPGAEPADPTEVAEPDELVQSQAQTDADAHASGEHVAPPSGAATAAPAPETGDLVIDAALRDLAEAPEDDLDAQVERGEQVQRTLQGRLSDLGG